MILYFDPFAGISGDMILGALLDLGVSIDYLHGELRKLPLKGYDLRSRKVQRAEIASIKCDVNITIDEHAGHRNLAIVKNLINESTLSNWVREKATLIFTRIAEAEAKIHNVGIEQIHFHEVGSVDAIIDVVGSLIGFEKLGINLFMSAPVNVGHGFVETEQGTFPVPAPATCELLKGVPTYATEIKGELATPTGAAILSVLVSNFGARPLMSIQRIGYGAGSREYDRFPNVLRIILGEPVTNKSESLQDDMVTVIEANIDDMNPQFFGYVFDKILEVGALDAYFTPVQMKKNRPGTLLTIISPDRFVNRIIELIFRETTTIGVRYSTWLRHTMDRSYSQVQTDYGAVRIKVCKFGAKVLNWAPEFEDCRRIAENHGLPIKEVYSLAMKKFMEMTDGKNLD